MIKFLIKNHIISSSTQSDTWKKMIFRGILKHRTSECLRNQFRRGILPFIEDPHLKQNVLDEFLKLLEKIGVTSQHKPATSDGHRF